MEDLVGEDGRRADEGIGNAAERRAQGGAEHEGEAFELGRRHGLVERDRDRVPIDAAKIEAGV